MNENTVSNDPNLAILIPIVNALGELCESIVFVGGCVTGLLLTEKRSQSIRVTMDVDVIAHVISTADYHAIGKTLQSKGFKPDLSPDAPICRWTWNGVALDLMPSEQGILGFHNRWYPLALKTATPMQLPGNIAIRIISAPVFVATKLEAFHGRGNRDYLASHDLDIITVISGRKELIDEIQISDVLLQNYLADELKQLLGDSNFVMSLPGHLPGDVASQARLTPLLQRMQEIAQKNYGRSV